MTYEEADTEAKSIIGAIQHDGEKWHYMPFYRDGAYAAIIGIIAPHPKKRAGWCFVVPDDDLKEMASISEPLNEGITLVRRMANPWQTKLT